MWWIRSIGVSPSPPIPKTGSGPGKPSWPEFLIDGSVRITMRGFSGFDTSYAAVPSAPAIHARPLRSTCTSWVAMPVMAGTNWPAFFGFAGSRRSTIWMPRAVPAR